MVIMCPYCLGMQDAGQTDGYNCNTCGTRLPKKYMEAAFRGSQVCLGTFGLPRHGKTAFLSNLTLVMDYLHKVVPGAGAFLQPLDDYSQRTVNEWSAMDQKGQAGLLPTPLNDDPQAPQIPLILLLSNFPSTQSRILVTYDLAGEALDKAGSEPEYVRALHKVETVWFIISLPDLMKERKTGHSMRNLFDVYEQAMDKLNVPIEGKNIIVVYTKADKLLSSINDSELPRLPDEVYSYLEDDYADYEFIKERKKAELNSFDEDAYFRKMREISEVLREFTNESVAGGGAFLAMARTYGAQVVFTINSAYGEDPGTGTLPTRAHPKRILDALLWAIEIGRQGGPHQAREIALIVPAVLDSVGVASQETIMHFYQALTAQGGHVATYSVGRAGPAFPVGTAPVQIESAQRLPLIGPILDQLKTGTLVVLLTSTMLPLDLTDFANSPWLNRLLVVTSRREMLIPWLRHRELLLQGSEVEQIVSSFLNRVSAG